MWSERRLRDIPGPRLEASLSDTNAIFAWTRGKSGTRRSATGTWAPHDRIAHRLTCHRRLLSLLRPRPRPRPSPPPPRLTVTSHSPPSFGSPGAAFSHVPPSPPLLPPSLAPRPHRRLRRPSQQARPAPVLRSPRAPQRAGEPAECSGSRIRALRFSVLV